MKIAVIDAESVLRSVSTLENDKQNSVRRYDAMRFIVALQGVLNRETPRIYLETEPHDRFWLDYLSENGKILCGAERHTVSSFSDFLGEFANEIRNCGLILWDATVPATVNVATTVCGVENRLPVRAGSDILQMILDATGAEIKIDLSGMFTGKGTIPETSRLSSGSAKCDAYLWAVEKYLDRTDPKLLFYTLDGISWDDKEPCYPDLGNAFVYNHDYAISRRAFVFDLSSYGDEVPCDDPTQPLGCDLATMKEILSRQYERTQGKEMITVCGFNPWQIKYTRFGGKGKHGEVDAEWRFTEVISEYNCIKDADAAGYCALANASVYRHFPLENQYCNHRPKADIPYEKDKNYVLIYVGDYDASAWTARFIPRWFHDPKLGENPLMFCFNTNLSDRIPQAFDFIYHRYPENCFFEAGDSGAGYNNPRLLYEPRTISGKPSGVETWVKHNQRYFSKFDQQVIGFVIDGDKLTNVEEMHDMAKFASLGVGYLSLGNDVETKIIDGTVFIPVTSDIGAIGANPEDVANNLIWGIRHTHRNKQFHIFRTILLSPSELDSAYRIAKEKAPELNIEFCDPFNFFRLAKQAKEN